MTSSAPSSATGCAHAPMVVKHSYDFRTTSLFKLPCDQVRLAGYLTQFQTFAQVQMSAALVKRDARWVGVQLVAPEDDPVSLKNYHEHMKMVGWLTDRGRAVNVALHAGELTYDIAPPEDLSFHIAEAIHVAGAREVAVRRRDAEGRLGGMVLIR